MKQRYGGTSGSTQGDRKLSTPAPNRRLIGFFTDVLKHGQEVKRPQVAGHAGDLDLLAATGFFETVRGFGEELDGRRVTNVIQLGQFLLRHHLAVEVRHFARDFDVELHDIEVGFDVVADLGDGEVDEVHLAAIGAALQFPDNGEPLAFFAGRIEIVLELQEAVQEPGLSVMPVALSDGLIAFRRSPRGPGARGNEAGADAGGQPVELSSRDHGARAPSPLNE